MDKYRLSRSELGSSSSINEPEDIGKKYKKYKDLCVQLINENDELKQVIYLKIFFFLLVYFIIKIKKMYH